MTDLPTIRNASAAVRDAGDRVPELTRATYFVISPAPKAGRDRQYRPRHDANASLRGAGTEMIRHRNLFMITGM